MCIYIYQKNSSAQQARKAGYRISKDFTSEEDEVSDRVSKLPSTSKIRRNRNLDISFSEDDKNKSRKKLHNGKPFVLPLLVKQISYLRCDKRNDVLLNRFWSVESNVRKGRFHCRTACLENQLMPGYVSQ